MDPPHRYHRPHPHTDLILATASNFTGTRLALASADHRLTVWHRDPTNHWSVLGAPWPAHAAAITAVGFGGPRAGEPLASIGQDGWVRVWTEDHAPPTSSARRFVQVWQRASPSLAGWPFVALSFRWGGDGATLATVTRDGVLSICEPEEGGAEAVGEGPGWGVLWEETLGGSGVPADIAADEPAFRLSWHQERCAAWQAVVAGLDPASSSLAVGAGDTVRVLRTDHHGSFYDAAVLEGARDLVRDVAWAGGSMRGFDVIATASRDGWYRVYELHTPGAGALSTRGRRPSATATTDSVKTVGASRSGIGAGLADGQTRGPRDEVGAVVQEARLVAELECRDDTPWRVSWNPVGDLLVTTSDDGTVRLWRKAVDGKWTEAAELDGSEEI